MKLPSTASMSADIAHPYARGRVAAQWLLRIAVAMYSVGLAVALWNRAGTSMGGLALMRGIAPDHIVAAEQAAAWIMLLAGLGVLVWPMTPLLVLIAAAIFAEAFAGYRFGGRAFAEFIVFAHALRYLAPLALIPLITSTRLMPEGPWRIAASSAILRIGLAIVFITHGIEAFQLHPEFIDLIIGTCLDVFNWPITEAQAVLALQVIGIVDVVVGVLIVLARWRPLLTWLCFWALITAASRVTALGLGAYPEVLLRASQYLAPLAVWALACTKSPAISTRRNET